MIWVDVFDPDLVFFLIWVLRKFRILRNTEENMEKLVFQKCTFQDVDRHVADINTKIKSAQERNLKGYFIAKLYYQVNIIIIVTFVQSYVYGVRD